MSGTGRGFYPPGKDALEGLRGIFRAVRDSSAYPPLLGEIYDPPALLYYRGKLPDPAVPAIALVGTRKPSAAASRQALELGREFARYGIPVISGLALGIDALAHRGCLEAGGCTAAVLGSSVDEVYPASNRGLARRILEAGGSLISEYPCGTGPRKWHFPQRNRIISGIARGTVIVEAPASSGALHTARFALEQGRDLFVASAGTASPLGEGTRRLARDGCRVISRAAEVLAEWGIDGAAVERNGGSRVESGGTGLPCGAALAESLRQELGV
ncbi:MAG: DNA-processing protein DprA [Spirochaetaceae bacterium]|jgi:DNA processing protein|nr:DNA-processing protein DprA [Spirochaetaceae bacterium]